MRNPNKNFYNFLLLWSGEFISAVGSGLTSFGLCVYVFEQTGQASAMALVPRDRRWRHMLNIALPKGRLGDKVYGLFSSIGYDLSLIHIYASTR